METRRSELTPDLFEQIEAGSQDNERIVGPPIGSWRASWNRLKKNRGALVGLVVIVVVIAVAYVGPLLPGRILLAGSLILRPNSGSGRTSSGVICGVVCGSALGYRSISASLPPC